MLYTGEGCYGLSLTGLYQTHEKKKEKLKKLKSSGWNV